MRAIVYIFTLLFLAPLVRANASPEVLVTWSSSRPVKIAADGDGCAWAPEAIHDEDTGDYEA
jgi:hypothetical protein